MDGSTRIDIIRVSVSRSADDGCSPQTDLHDQSGRRVAQVTQTQAVLGEGA